MGRIVQVLVDNDGKASTGVSRTDNEGNPVAGIDQVLAYTYNVKGEVTEMRRDNNVDGKYDYREAYTLNANGNWIEKQVDLTNDGTFDRKEVYTKEADDGLVKTNFYNLVEGREVLTKVEDYTLNTNNQRTSMKVDTLGDGTTDSITRYDLDALGRVAKAYFDTDGDGTVDRADIYTRDSNGNTVRTEIDTGNNGTIDSVTTYERDALGQVTKEMIDSDNNGQFDIVRHQEYDEFGNLLSRKIDNGNDGTINEAYYWTYNELKQQTHLIYDRTGNGVTDDDSRYEYFYDEFGQEVSRLTQNNLSSPMTLNLNEYDSLGRRIKASVDGDNDGKISSARDSIIEYSYDAMNLTNGETRYDGTGQLLFTADLDRNDAGVIVRSYRDNGGNGTVDSLHYGYLGPNWTQNYTDDLTKWSAEQLAKVKGLPYIQLSGATYETTITLDKATLAKIAPTSNTLRIAGDATDTVNLEGFTQSASSSRAGHNQYTADVDGTTYTVFITNTVDTVLG